MYFYHNSRDLQYRNPYGAATAGSTVTLRADGTLPWGSKVYVRLWQPGALRVMMLPDSEGKYACTVRLPEDPSLVWYHFELETPEGMRWYGLDESCSGGAGRLSQIPMGDWQITVSAASELPDWYAGSVAYQIFPDRFHRGEDWMDCQRRAAHPAGWRGTKRMVLQDWNDTPFYIRDPENRVIRWPFFGGNLSGIREKLDYLRSLGVGVLYLNPIFLASSNHKYDTADYRRIDPGFGDERAFSTLCEEAKRRGIRILLDGVFSHIGDDSVYFNRYGNYPEPGAFSDEESPYDKWFCFDESEPCGYACWWNVDSLPNVDETNPDYQEMICGENGVIRKWLRLGASGWRLDVADELPDEFIEKIRAAARAEKPDALILGEVWEDASNKVSYGVQRRYLLGSELDCTMHYPFRAGALDFLLGKCSARDFAEAMEVLREHYPEYAIQGAFNIIGTHDTPRILTVLGEAPDGLTEAQREHYRLPPEKRARAETLLRLLQVLQFTVPGVPCVYYGDEAGMEGYADPYNRGPFPWDSADRELTDWVKRLSALRLGHKALTEGDSRFDAWDDDTFKLTRSLEGETITVYVSRAWDQRSLPPLGEAAEDLLTGTLYEPDQEIPLPPLSALVLRRE